MVNVCAAPEQLPSTGVTVMVAVWAEPTLDAGKLMLPVPLAPRPIAGLLFVQLNVGFPVPEKPTLTCSPAQTVWFAGSTTVGAGLMVMVNETGTPSQLPMVGVMVTVPVCVVVTLAAVRSIFPTPLIGRPIAGLELVQLKVAPLVPERLIKMDWPLQMEMLAGWLTVGAGLTVMVNVCEAPTQPFSMGVTVIVPVCWLATRGVV